MIPKLISRSLDYNFSDKNIYTPQRSLEKEKEFGEMLARRPKHLEEFPISLYSQFKFLRFRVRISSFRYWNIKCQFHIGSIQPTVQTPAWVFLLVSASCSPLWAVKNQYFIINIYYKNSTYISFAEFLVWRAVAKRIRENLSQIPVWLI